VRPAPEALVISSFAARQTTKILAMSDSGPFGHANAETLTVA
jgi:hypothetical protein